MVSRINQLQVTKNNPMFIENVISIVKIMVWWTNQWIFLQSTILAIELHSREVSQIYLRDSVNNRVLCMLLWLHDNSTVLRFQENKCMETFKGSLKFLSNFRWNITSSAQKLATEWYIISCNSDHKSDCLQSFNRLL